MTDIGDNDRARSRSAERSIAQFIDYTLLRADATRRDIEQLCRDAVVRGFCAVCVNGGRVALARQRVDASSVMVATVVGFPLGAVPSRIKAAEAAAAAEQGADEIDMMISVGHLIDNELAYVADDVAAVVQAVPGRTVKVILETAALSRDQVVDGAHAAQRAGAHMVKTSTGFHPRGGATIDAVRLLRSTVAETMGVKASGGVRDLSTAIRLIEAGASRIGTSSLLE